MAPVIHQINRYIKLTNFHYNMDVSEKVLVVKASRLQVTQGAGWKPAPQKL